MERERERSIREGGEKGFMKGFLCEESTDR